MVVSSPILTRLFTPNDFGIFSLFVSVSGIISVIATLRYEMAIMLPKETKKSFNLLILSILISFIISFITFLLILAFNKFFVKTFELDKIGKWILLVPFSVLFTGLYQSMNYWVNKNKSYKELSVSRVLQSSSTVVINIIAGLFKISGGLILGTLFGQIFSFFYLLLKSFKRRLLKLINFRLIKKLAVEYSDFPIKSTPGIFLNVLANYFPVILISTLYGNTVLGFFALIIKILNMPLGIIGSAVSQVFYQESNDLKSNTKLLDLFKKTSTRLALIFTIPAIIILLFGETIFAVVFGQEWAEAGRLSKIFIPYYAMRFIFSTQSTILTTKRKIGIELAFNFIFLVLQIAGIYIGYYFFTSYIYSFTFLTASGFIMYSALGVILYKLLKKEN